MSVQTEEPIRDEDIAHLIAGALFVFLTKKGEQKDEQ